MYKYFNYICKERTLAQNNYRRFSSTTYLRNGGFSAFLETFVLIESSGIFSNFGAEKPPLLQAAKRCGIYFPKRRLTN